jgi:hypothetical protein
MVDDDGSGTVGTIINNAWKTELYNQIDATPAGGGIWSDVPYWAIVFHAPPGTFSVPEGGLVAFRHLTLGKLMIVQFELGGASVSGSPTALLIDFQTPAVPVGNPLTLSGFFLDAGTNTFGYVQAQGVPGGIRITNVKWDWQVWKPAAANTTLWGQAIFPIY